MDNEEGSRVKKCDTIIEVMSNHGHKPDKMDEESAKCKVCGLRGYICTYKDDNLILESILYGHSCYHWLGTRSIETCKTLKMRMALE